MIQQFHSWVYIPSTKKKKKQTQKDISTVHSNIIYNCKYVNNVYGDREAT